MGRPLNLHRFGGLTSNTGKQIQVRAKVAVPAPAVSANRAASLLKQKNQYSFHVQDSTGVKGICRLVNKANGSLLDGEMNLVATPSVGPAFRLKKITNRFCWDFLGNRFRWAFDPATGKVVVTSA